MNFHNLSRKDLQALSKKNKIPANITNVAMADALSALPQVEGLDEILNPREGDAGTPAIRTSTQRKAVKESESSVVSTRPSRGTRAVVEQENKDAHVSATPAMVPSSRRRVPAVSTRRKKEVIVIEDGDDDKNVVEEKVPKTPAAAPSSRKRATGRSVCNKKETPSGTSVQKGYSTRRSVRLLGKSLSEMSLMETEDMGLSKVDDVSEELSGVSQHEEDSSNTEKGASLQTMSTVLAENTEEYEVSSLNKADYESQSNNLVLQLKIVSETEPEAEDQLQAAPQEEVSEKDAEDELHDSIFDACDGSNAAGSELPELGESCVSAKQDASSGEVSEETSSFVISVGTNDAGSEQPKLKESCDSAKLEDKEYDVIKQESFSVAASEEASMEFADKCIVPSDEFPESHVAGSELIELEESGDSGEFRNKECFGNQADDLSAEISEASAEISEEVSANASMEICNQDVSPVVESDGDCVDVPDQCVPALLYVRPPVQGITEGIDEIQDMNHDETENLNVADGNGILICEHKHVDVDEHSEAVLEMDSYSSGQKQEPKEESLDVMQEVSEESVDEIEKTNSDISGVVNEVCIEDVTHQLSLLGVVPENEAEDKKEASERGEPGAANSNMMKENLTTAYDYQNMSMRGLIKKLKEIDGKVNKKTISDAGLQEVEKKKRTALQALSQNSKLTTA